MNKGASASVADMCTRPRASALTQREMISMCPCRKRENACSRVSQGDHRMRKQSLHGCVLNIWVCYIFHLKHMSCPSQPMLNITVSLSNHFDELSQRKERSPHVGHQKASGHNPGICFPKRRPWCLCALGNVHSGTTCQELGWSKITMSFYKLRFWMELLA